MKRTVLFQGDSLTDANRDRERKDFENLYGHGYVNLIAASLLCDYPETSIINNAINGDRICDLYRRWIEDTLNVDFNVISILCGINDIGFELRMNKGADAEKFEFVYDRMLYEIKKEKPAAKTVLCEPFIFKLDTEGEYGAKDIIENWDIWNGMMKERRAIVKKLAKKYQSVWVPTGEIFEKAIQKAPASHWSMDGIHLTIAGAELLSREWLNRTMHIFS